MKFLFIYLSIFTVLLVQAQQVIPTKQQMAAQEKEFYLFAHFGPNTFTGLEWGHGTEKAEVFDPVNLDCEQWARVAKATGAKGIIITAKHHDGFCLWPSKYSTHTVRESSWRNGKGDVLKELSDACKKYGIGFGVYISPWDRNHPLYGTDEYNQVFINMMKEVLTNYGPVWELWWDGANGEGPNGKKQVYNWQKFRETVTAISPNTVVFSDIGPHLRWVGNEKGFVGQTNWNTLNIDGFEPGLKAPHRDTLFQGNINGTAWVSAECDVSIRPGWFYHKNEQPKTARQLFDIYLKSVGRGANLLLNVPPDDKGKFDDKDVAALTAFKKLRDDAFANNNVTKWNKQSAEKYEARLKKDAVINCVLVQEELSKGQHIIAGNILLYKNNAVVKTIPFTTIGHKRILTFDAVPADVFAVQILQHKGNPVIKNIAAYKIDATLVEKEK